MLDGKTYLARREKQKVEIWYDGQKITEPLARHPAFKGVLNTTARLYDIQNNRKLAADMSFRMPDSNEKAGVSYLRPKTKQDLKRRRKMITHWAKHTNGMMGRSPDYMNTVMMSYAASASLLKGRENCFPENLEALYWKAMKEDLSFTHTFITPQMNRSQVNLGFSQEPISARVVDKSKEGLIIKGARLLATQGGLTDELLVYTAPRVFFDPAQAFAFSIPSDSAGLKFICRESFVGGESSFNYPLSSMFDETDAIVVFDHVVVPWNRVFFYDNVDAATDFKLKSAFHSLTYHQVIIRQVAKTAFILGLAEMMVGMINVDEYQHIQEKMSEMIIGLETMKALLEKSENDAALDDWGTMRPSMPPLQVAGNIFPRIYPRFCEIIQLIGASGMITLPTEKDFDSSLRTDLNTYLPGDKGDAYTRVKLFRLAWELTMSAFGTRQTQYERYFFGDPVRLSSLLYRSYPSAELADSVRRFLEGKDHT